MNTCKTCKHWLVDDETGWNAKQCCTPEDDNGAVMVMPFEVRECRHPAKTFCERPVEINGFGATDASQYCASLLTAEEFGCVRHEAA